MDEQLENFVGLLNQHRQTKPVSEDLRHLPTWARQALQELPDASQHGASGHAPTRTLATARLTSGIGGRSDGGDVALAERPESLRPVSDFKLLKPTPNQAEKPKAPIEAEKLKPPVEVEKPKPRKSTRTVDFAALVKAAKSPTFDLKAVAEESLSRRPDVLPPESSPSDEAAKDPTQRKYRLVHMLLPALALAVVAAGGAWWHAAHRVHPARETAALTRGVNQAADQVAIRNAVPPVASPGKLDPIKVVRVASVAATKPPAPAPTVAVAKPVPKSVPIVAAVTPTLAVAKPAPKSVPIVAAVTPPPTANAKPEQVAAAAEPLASAPDPKPVPPAKPSAKSATPDVMATEVPGRSHVSHDTQVAMLTPPNLSDMTAIPEMSETPPSPPTHQSASEPAWLRYAVPAPAFNGEPRIAIVIDDLGLDKHRTARAIALDGRVTLSFLAYASDLPQQTAAARQAGHELIVHVPMEPIIRPSYLGRPAKTSSAFEQQEILRRLKWDLSRFKGYVGVDNRLGSELSRNQATAQTVMTALKRRGLLFLDARSGDAGTAFDVAERVGVPTVARDVFLDNDISSVSIEARLAALEKLAKTQGTAIAIGRPHDRTLDALTAWIATLKSKGIQLVPLTAIVKQRARRPVRVN